VREGDLGIGLGFACFIKGDRLCRVSDQDTRQICIFYLVLYREHSAIFFNFFSSLLLLFLLFLIYSNVL